MDNGKQTARGGVALVVVLLFVAVLVLLGTALTHTVGTQANITRVQVDREKAFFVAEAGMERASSYVAHDGVLPAAFSGVLGDGEYHVTITLLSSVAPLPGPGGGILALNGELLVNPNNSPDSEFTMTLPDGSTITRDNLADRDFQGYEGAATYIRVKPHGNGNQNTMTVDGSPYPVANADTYDITAGAMAVALFNDKRDGNGKAMGRWHIQIAATRASIVVTH